MNCPLKKDGRRPGFASGFIFTESLYFVSTDLYLEGPIFCFKLPFFFLKKINKSIPSALDLLVKSYISQTLQEPRSQPFIYLFFRKITNLGSFNWIKTSREGEQILSWGNQASTFLPGFQIYSVSKTTPRTLTAKLIPSSTLSGKRTTCCVYIYTRVVCANTKVQSKYLLALVEVEPNRLMLFC